MQLQSIDVEECRLSQSFFMVRARAETLRVNELICVQCVDSSRCLCSPMMVVPGHTGNHKVWTFFKQRLNKMVLCTLCETEMACRDSSPTAAQRLSRSIWKENILGLFYLKIMRLQRKYLDYNLDYFYIALEYGCQSHILRFLRLRSYSTLFFYELP